MQDPFNNSSAFSKQSCYLPSENETNQIQRSAVKSENMSEADSTVNFVNLSENRTPAQDNILTNIQERALRVHDPGENQQYLVTNSQAQGGTLTHGKKTESASLAYSYAAKLGATTHTPQEPKKSSAQIFLSSAVTSHPVDAFSTASNALQRTQVATVHQSSESRNQASCNSLEEHQVVGAAEYRINATPSETPCHFLIATNAKASDHGSLKKNESFSEADLRVTTVAEASPRSELSEHSFVSSLSLESNEHDLNNDFQQDTNQSEDSSLASPPLYHPKHTKLHYSASATPSTSAPTARQLHSAVDGDVGSRTSSLSPSPKLEDDGEESGNVARLNNSLLEQLAAATMAVGGAEVEDIYEEASNGFMGDNCGHSSAEQRRERFPPPPVGKLEDPEHYGINMEIRGDLVTSSDVTEWEFPDMVKLKQLRDRLIQFMTDNHLKQADICRFTGLGAPYLSFMVKDPTISNFSSKRRVEVYSVLKAFFQKIDKEEVTLDDIARLVLLSKATARAANSKKRGINGSASGSDKPAPVRRRRRGRPRTLERIREGADLISQSATDKCSFEDFVAATSSSPSSHSGDVWNTAAAPSGNVGVGQEGWSNVMQQNQKEGHTVSGSAATFGDDFAVILSRNLELIRQRCAAIPYAHDGTTATRGVKEQPTTENADVLAQALLPLLCRSSMSNFRHVADILQSSTARRIAVSTARRAQSAPRPQPAAFENDVAPVVSPPNEPSQTDIFNSLMERALLNILPPSTTTIQVPDGGGITQQNGLNASVGYGVKPIPNTEPPAFSINGNSDHSSATTAAEQNTTLQGQPKTDLTSTAALRLPSLRRPPSNVFIPHSANVTQMETDAHMRPAEMPVASIRNVQAVPHVTKPVILTPDRAPPILSLLRPRFDNGVTTPIRQMSKTEGSSKESSTSLQLTSLIQSILVTSDRPQNMSGHDEPLRLPEEKPKIHTTQNQRREEQVRFGKGWWNEVDLGMTTHFLDLPTSNLQSSEVMESASSTRPCTDDEADDTGPYMPLPSSGKVYPIRLRWKYGHTSGDEDILWDLTDTGSSVEAFIESYVRDMQLPRDSVSKDLIKSFREQLESGQSFEDMFTAVTNHIGGCLKQKTPRVLPGMTRRILLDCHQNGIRVVDAIQWNLCNTPLDARNLIKRLIHEMNLPTGFMSTMFPAFLRAVVKEKLVGLSSVRLIHAGVDQKYIYECSELLMGGLQDELTAQSAIDLRLLSWNKKRTKHDADMCLEPMSSEGLCKKPRGNSDREILQTQLAGSQLAPAAAAAAETPDEELEGDVTTADAQTTQVTALSCQVEVGEKCDSGDASGDPTNASKSNTTNDEVALTDPSSRSTSAVTPPDITEASMTPAALPPSFTDIQTLSCSPKCLQAPTSTLRHQQQNYQPQSSVGCRVSGRSPQLQEPSSDSSDRIEACTPLILRNVSPGPLSRLVLEEALHNHGFLPNNPDIRHDDTFVKSDSTAVAVGTDDVAALPTQLTDKRLRRTENSSIRF